MAHHQRVQLAGHGQVAAAGEVGVDPVLDRAQPCLTQAGGFGLDAHTSLDVGQRLASPEAECLAEHRRRLRRVAGGGATSRLLDQLEELMLVDDVVGDGEPVARCHQLEERGCVGGAEQLAHRGHSDLQHPPRRSAGSDGQSSSMSRSAPTTRPRRMTSSASSARSFGAGGVTSTPSMTTSSGPSTRTATSTRTDPREPSLSAARGRRKGPGPGHGAPEVQSRRSWLCTSSAALLRGPTRSGPAGHPGTTSSRGAYRAAYALRSSRASDGPGRRGLAAPRGTPLGGPRPSRGRDSG